jgi:hypothetical protein
MRPGAAWPKLFLLVLLGIGLAHRALACNEAPVNARAQQVEAGSRIFLIDLQLSQSGRVRAVEVLIGTGPLRSEAIKIAARGKHPPRSGNNPATTAVEVRFSGRRDRRPEVREVPLGVPSCIPGGIPLESPMKRWVNQLLSTQPLIPFIATQSDPQANGAHF